MPKETFGGDDDEEGEEEVVKPKLSKFDLPPDTNIRDVFWKIMASYSAAKKPGTDLSMLSNDRFALMRASLSVLTRQDSHVFGLPPRFIALYTLMMMIDGRWDDVLYEFLERSLELRKKSDMKYAVKTMLANENYREELTKHFIKMLRKRETVGAGIAFLSEVGDRDLALSMKKDLIIIARGDIGENQHNAIKLVSLIRDDEEVKKSFMLLLSHWDKEARMAAAEALQGMKDKDVKEAAEKRLEKETYEDVIKLLKRLVK